jgi:hypothetical protein
VVGFLGCELRHIALVFRSLFRSPSPVEYFLSLYFVGEKSFN